MKHNPIDWFEIYVQDIARAKKFYESVFQITLQKLDSPMPEVELWAFPAEMNLYGACGALVKMQGFTSSGNSTIVYFHCDDCSVEEGRATKVPAAKFSVRKLPSASTDTSRSSLIPKTTRSACTP